MQKVQIYMQNEAAHETVDRLGDKGLVMFKDLNSDKTAFQRTFANYVKRCDEMERVLRYLDTSVNNANIKVANRAVDRRDEPNFTDLQMKLEELEKEVRKLNDSQETLQRTHDEVVELKCVLDTASTFFGTSIGDIGTGEETFTEHEPVATPLLEAQNPIGGKFVAQRLGCVTGVIMSSDTRRFERMLWRATRGNVYIKSAPIKEAIKDPKTGDVQDKSVIAIFYSGERSLQKIIKLCDTNGVNKYACPEDPSDRSKLKSETMNRLDDLRTVIDRTLTTQNAVLSKIAMSLSAWQYQVKREKAIYHTLNLTNFDRKRQCLIAEGWVATKNLGVVSRVLQDASVDSGASVPSVLQKLSTKETPPTHFETNRFTYAYQNIVDSYGIARYQEYNPAVFTVITFPFLFAVMFGDAGHGTIMTIFAAMAIWKEKQLAAANLNEMFKTPFAGRYVLLLMGLFSIYTGSIYNDAFSQPYDFFESQWEEGTNESLAFAKDGMKLLNQKHVGNPYPFGIDPEWSHTGNKLNFYNSFKMKISIIFGVTQMIMGNLCKLTNALHFKKKKDLLFEFIPEILFMSCLFGYLCLLIVIKWNTDWDTKCVFIAPGETEPGNLNAGKIVNCCVRTPDNLCNGMRHQSIILPEDQLGGWKGLIPESLNTDTLFVGDRAGILAGACEVDGKKYPEMFRSKVYNTQGVIFKELGGCFKQSPPGLLDTLIKMFMDIGNVPVEMQLYSGQGFVQICLILVAVCAIPVLLFPKPCLERREHMAAAAARHHSDDEEEEEYDFSEHMVHQIIHTIEYVLGAVSNTASYLRLWALSLAHAELSEVFWDKVLADNLHYDEEHPMSTTKYTIVVFLGFSVWTVLTFGVLMVMESLSAFLHALRLHWVEFQNKFYIGDGYKFVPFSYDIIFGEDGEGEE
jgi:V-type H+-transporting ATPase subunit a